MIQQFCVSWPLLITIFVGLLNFLLYSLQKLVLKCFDLERLRRTGNLLFLLVFAVITRSFSIKGFQDLVLPLQPSLELHLLLIFAHIDLFHCLDLIVQLEIALFLLCFHQLGEFLFLFRVFHLFQKILNIILVVCDFGTRLFFTSPMCSLKELQPKTRS